MTVGLFERLAEVGVRRSLDKGEILFHQEDTARGLYCLHDGRMRLARQLESGYSLTLTVLNAPTLVAEASLFVDKYHCRAEADCPCTVSLVGKREVFRLIEEEPGFAVALVQLLSREVRELRARLELRNIRRARDRVLAFLHLESLRGVAVVSRPLSTVASELGLTPEAMYRAVKKLEDEGRVVRAGRSSLSLA